MIRSGLISRSSFLVSTAPLLRSSDPALPVRIVAPMEGLVVGDTAVGAEAPVTCDLLLEAVHGGVLATGEVRATWVGECRRCLDPAAGEVVAQVQELFESKPRPGESYPLDPEQLDLEPMVREAVLLELPLAPLCRDDCAGLCPTCGAPRSVGPCSCPSETGDPRWAALDVLRESTPNE